MLTGDLDGKGLIELLGLENASIEDQTKIIQSATETVEAQVFDHILSELNDEETHIFMELFEDKSEDGLELGEFLAERGLDIPAILEKEIAKFKEEILKA